MDLRTWLNKTRTQPTALARVARVSKNAIYRVLWGRRLDPETARRLSLATGGAVPLDILLFPGKPKTGKR